MFVFLSIGLETRTLSTQQTEEMEETRSFRHGIAETSENGNVFTHTHTHTHTHTAHETVLITFNKRTQLQLVTA